MKKWLVFFLWGMFVCSSQAQIGIGTTSPSASSEIEVSSTTKGVLFPRMTNTQMLAISSPATGLQVYNSDANNMYYYNGSNWVSTLNSCKMYANAGTNVQLDNIMVKMTTSGNRSLQMRTVSGTSTISGSSVNLYILTSAASTGSAAYTSGYTQQSISLNTTYAYWQAGADFPYHGSSQEIYLNDETNGKTYRILCIVGSGYNNNFFEIERLK